MKRIFSTLNLTCIGIILGLTLTVRAKEVFPLSTDPQPVAVGSLKSGQIKQVDVLRSLFREPSTLVISRLGTEATIEKVGLDAKNNMDVPKDDMNVAWYSLGGTIGQQGNAVIAGHFDTRTGAPAIFYNLSSLEIGDSIEVFDTNGVKVVYNVTEIERYPYDGLPLNDVFGVTDKYRLNLITCDGVFDSIAQIYQERLVVYSELKRRNEL